ncbi:hypothetical protein [Neolewinella antarctica]|uniref:Uncharacterized protein n=1 Tax=Neolewinella antarctica TaxID=442734 RepID=A0ABX0XGV6_9BACT|nr:hypothetical protein [Neolewinella antarctica]NJC28008.1 hypothetical protein [Neolewinella antarctica]
MSLGLNLMGVDPWATLAFYNQQRALKAAVAARIARKTKHRKYTYRMNRNVTAGILQQFRYHIYLDGPSNWRAKIRMLLELCSSYPEPYRPRVGRKRTRKIMRAQHRRTHDRRKQQRS